MSIVHIHIQTSIFSCTHASIGYSFQKKIIPAATCTFSWGRSELTDRNVELYPQFFSELITTQLRFYMVSPQLSLLIILTMQSYTFYLCTFSFTPIRLYRQSFLYNVHLVPLVLFVYPVVRVGLLINPFASGIKKVLLYPITGLFSVKIRKKFLAIKNFSVNDTMSGQPNKRLIHWHFEN